ncbi:hypothetical protein HHI36_023307 [Cryptolaemus montrouzieri]|uniref:Uncharacterized protein n=1 Tax=Cryptolaemus montrouzieri TaxID=559131 RepID=A0ABD2PFZ0_9CUCU
MKIGSQDIKRRREEQRTPPTKLRGTSIKIIRVTLQRTRVLENDYNLSRYTDEAIMCVWRESHSGSTNGSGKGGNICISTEEQLQTNASNGDAEFNQNVERIGRRIQEHTAEDYRIDEVTTAEVQEHINQLKTKKARGLDGIPNQALKNLPGEGI